MLIKKIEMYGIPGTVTLEHGDYFPDYRIRVNYVHEVSGEWELLSRGFRTLDLAYAAVDDMIADCQWKFRLMSDGFFTAVDFMFSPHESEELVMATRMLPDHTDEGIYKYLYIPRFWWFPKYFYRKASLSQALSLGYTRKDVKLRL